MTETTARYHVIAANKAHFESLVNDFKKDFRLLTSGKQFAEFEDLQTGEITFVEF